MVSGMERMSMTKKQLVELSGIQEESDFSELDYATYPDGIVVYRRPFAFGEIVSIRELALMAHERGHRHPEICEILGCQTKIPERPIARP